MASVAVDALKEMPLFMISGPNAMSRMQFGMVQQPWFIGTVIGTVGGALWFALCVFSLWLCRRRQRRRKYPRSNGVVSGTLLSLYGRSHGRQNNVVVHRVMMKSGL